MIGHLFLVDFITDHRLGKNVFFPNLMWMVKISRFLSPEGWLLVGKMLGTPQRLSKDSPFFDKALIFGDW